MDEHEMNMRDYPFLHLQIKVKEQSISCCSTFKVCTHFYQNDKIQDWKS